MPSTPHTQPSGDHSPYRNRLREFIIGPRSKMLLHAGDFFPNAPMQDRQDAVFHLASGRYRREFISLWELFDNGSEFDECIRKLTEKAVQISEEGYIFNTIVTCTHTARELVRHIRPGIEKRLNRHIEVSEFGHYPYSAAAELELNAFRSRNVLIFTDVMASGSLVRDMTTQVERSGGNVMGGLCIVVSDSKLVQKLSDENVVRFPVRKDVLYKKNDIPIFTLTDYEIPELPDRSPLPSLICRIDFVTVFPEAPPLNGHVMKACFSRAQMLDHFRKTAALTHGFFEQDDRHCTLAVRVGRILSADVADEVWQAIQTYIGKDTVLVCTFKKDDLAFGRFVLDRIRESGRPAELFVLKRELGDFPHLHQALFPNTEKVRGQNVVLLRAFATTSEELRSLAALLAGEQVTEIRVICLVNRMGPYTVSFVKRIQELVRGSHGSSARTRFDFVPVYSLTDVRTDDLVTMHRRVGDVLDKYARSTEVPFFRALAQEYRHKMAPDSMTTWRFESADDIDLSLAIAEVVEEIGRHRIEKLVTLIKSQELGPEQAEVFLLIAGLVISDVDYFRLSRLLRPVISAMRERLASLQIGRFTKEAEESQGSGRLSAETEILTTKIAGVLRLETHLLFALALLAHFDKYDATAEEVVKSVLFADMSTSDWVEYPLNLRYHFRDGHFYWLTALMLHGVHPDFFSQPARAQSRLRLAKIIRERIQDIVEYLPEGAHLGHEDRKLLPGRISDHKNDLLSELGALSRGLWHQRIRFLQHHILHRRLGHSPIWMALKSVEEDFRRWLEEANGAPNADLVAKMPRHIQEAHSAAITVGEIAEVAHHFALYPSQVVSEGLKGLFANPNAADSFAQEVVAPLLAFFHAGRGSPPATMADVEVYSALIFKVKEMILDPTCKLFQVLLSFCLPLRALLSDVLFDVDATFDKQGLKGVWATVIEREHKLLSCPDGEMFALCDSTFLREIFRNLCSNVRYNLCGPRITGSLDTHVRIELATAEENLPEPEAVRQDFVVITVEADGKSYTEVAAAQARKGYTLQSHIERIPEFGGSLEIGDGRDGHGSRAVIKLISRQELARLVADESAGL